MITITCLNLKALTPAKTHIFRSDILIPCSKLRFHNLKSILKKN